MFLSINSLTASFVFAFNGRLITPLIYKKVSKDSFFCVSRFQFLLHRELIYYSSQLLLRLQHVDRLSKANFNRTILFSFSKSKENIRQFELFRLQFELVQELDLLPRKLRKKNKFVFFSFSILSKKSKKQNNHEARATLTLSSRLRKSDVRFNVIERSLLLGTSVLIMTPFFMYF